jgi:hypothetical protein
LRGGVRVHRQPLLCGITVDVLTVALFHSTCIRRRRARRQHLGS